MNADFPPSERPDAATIHLWWVDLDGPAVEATGFLSAEECERADRFRFARDASRFRICRAMLRLGLGWYLGLSPRGIALQTGPFGKPYLSRDARLFFNVAHCDGLGVIAFSTLGEVGVDVEAAHRTVEAMDIASAFFTAKEAAQVAEAGSEQNNAFLRIWTRKEAVLKAVGRGLQQSLDSLDVTTELVSLDSSAAAAVSSCWRVVDLTARKGFASAIAAPPGAWSVASWDVSWEQAAARLPARFVDDLSLKALGPPSGSTTK